MSFCYKHLTMCQALHTALHRFLYLNPPIYSMQYFGAFSR